MLCWKTGSPRHKKKTKSPSAVFTDFVVCKDTQHGWFRATNSLTTDLQNSWVFNSLLLWSRTSWLQHTTARVHPSNRCLRAPFVCWNVREVAAFLTKQTFNWTLQSLEIWVELCSFCGCGNWGPEKQYRSCCWYHAHTPLAFTLSVHVVWFTSVSTCDSTCSSLCPPELSSSAGQVGGSGELAFPGRCVHPMMDGS